MTEYHHHYYLHEDKSITPCSLAEWSEQRQEMSRKRTKHVNDEMVDGKRVSTVWIGMNHSFKNGKPHILKTMVFSEKGDDIYCRRYSTWNEAVEGHKKAVQWVKDGSKDGIY